jgi:cytochrome c-type biogenesis protein CcmH/NrfG
LGKEFGMASKKQTRSAKQAQSPKKNNRLLIGWGIAAMAAVLFGVGFSMGWFNPRVEKTAEESAPTPGNPSVSSLSDLLPGLEAKVAANPNDMGQRLLLAQTYGELGQREKSIKELRFLRKADPKEPQVVIYLAVALLESDAKSDLQEAYKLLDEAVRMKPALMPMARMYQSDILVKLGDRQGAIKLLKAYLAQTSAKDERRAMFEEKLAKLSDETH